MLVGDANECDRSEMCEALSRKHSAPTKKARMLLSLQFDQKGIAISLQWHGKSLSTREVAAGGAAPKTKGSLPDLAIRPRGPV